MFSSCTATPGLCFSVSCFIRLKGPGRFNYITPNAKCFDISLDAYFGLSKGMWSRGPQGLEKKMNVRIRGFRRDMVKL